MGSFGPAFLQALAGNVAGGAVPGALQSSVGVVPPENGMSEGVMGFPSVARGGIPETGAIPGQGALPGVTGGGMDPEVEAVVRGFKPKKISFWGALGDQLLKHWGNKPAFEERINNINMQRAMEGFTQDPVEAIRRIGQIPGMQEKAWDLLNTYEDNRRANETAQSMVQTRREKIINSASRLFGPQSLAPDGSNYSTIRELFMNIMERNGIKDVYLPEDYNPDVINAQIAGDWTLNQQDMARYRPREQMRKEANTASQIARREAQTRQGYARISQDESQFVRSEQGKDRRSANKVKADGTVERKLKDGSSVRYSPDKATAIVTRPNGKKHYLQRQLDGSYKTVDPNTLKAK